MSISFDLFYKPEPRILVLVINQDDIGGLNPTLVTIKRGEKIARIYLQKTCGSDIMELILDAEDLPNEFKSIEIMVINNQGGVSAVHKIVENFIQHTSE
ncbi:hypothetical protein [Photobacterium leiognathi]|uniref:hypothetical protein n=1 Tax=Photobacterium leiognathi TaxID=553611 RepID=UPI0029820168|nr:hypothetical protein [Photobacterium leiognathi]